MKYALTIVLMLLISVAVGAQNQFEGEIDYRNFESHSKTVRKFSKGMAYNGARNVKVLVKGNKIHIIDESMHLNTLLDPDANSVIIYNDLLKKGLKCTYTDYTTTYMSAYGPKPTVNGQTKEYSVVPVNEYKEINGVKCQKYSGKVIAKVNGANPATTTVEVWCSNEHPVTPIYDFYLNGLQIPGVAMKWTTDQHGKIPLFGSMDSFVASEVKSITPREVDDSEMQIPTDYELKVTNSPFKMLGIYGDTVKYLKKNKMYPADADKNMDVTYKIEEEWDF
ncbi:hypothetical protein [Duncaniella muris]|uniref:hypothetical protein n=1 Tax=Duncaniella muris TaxID=2094150 RepID=UPI00272E8179|nr:hypothetical protein [Duncaniella muris]